MKLGKLLSFYCEGLFFCRVTTCLVIRKGIKILRPQALSYNFESQWVLPLGRALLFANTDASCDTTCNLHLHVSVRPESGTGNLRSRLTFRASRDIPKGEVFKVEMVNSYLGVPSRSLLCDFNDFIVCFVFSLRCATPFRILPGEVVETKQLASSLLNCEFSGGRNVLCNCSLARNVRSKQVYLFSPFSPAIKHVGDGTTFWKRVSFFGTLT